MSQPTQLINFQIVSIQTDFTDLNTISIINQGTIPLIVTNLDTSGAFRLLSNQSVTLNASTGFVLPSIRIDGASGFIASVITT
jgi:hypothetical protein